MRRCRLFSCATPFEMHRADWYRTGPVGDPEQRAPQTFRVALIAGYRTPGLHADHPAGSSEDGLIGDAVGPPPSTVGGAAGSWVERSRAIGGSGEEQTMSVQDEKGHFSEGQEHDHDSLQKQAVGSFAEGQEEEPELPQDYEVGHFSEGQEHDHDAPEEQGVGNFAERQSRH